MLLMSSGYLAPPTYDTSDFDPAELLSRVDDDIDVVVDLIDALRAEVPAHVAEIRRALDAGDHQTLSFAAHSLKGALATLSAGNAARAALALELAGRSQAVPNGPELFDRLERAIAGAERAFSRYCASLGEA
jgi:two-component system, sensor histidine kinase and response regulator